MLRKEQVWQLVRAVGHTCSYGYMYVLMRALTEDSAQLAAFKAGSKHEAQLAKPKVGRWATQLAIYKKKLDAGYPKPKITLEWVATSVGRARVLRPDWLY